MPEDASPRWSLEPRIGYPLVTEVAPSPDGSGVIYVVREPLLTDEKSEFISHLYLASPEASPEASSETDKRVQLTFGETRNRQPRWSPDGQYVAFLSSRSGRSNVYVMRAAGGEAWALTKYEKTDVASVKWSPDGRRLAFLMPEPPSEEAERKRRAKDDAKVFDVDLDFTHLFVVPFAVGPRRLPPAKQVTRGRFQVVDFDWFPAGDRIAICHRPQPEWDHWWETRLATVTVPVAGDAPVAELPTEAPPGEVVGAAISEPVDVALTGDWGGKALVSPDGRWIAGHAIDRPGKWALSGHVVVYPAGGQDNAVAAGAPRDLAETPDGKCELIGWSPDAADVYVLNQHGTSSQLWALPTSGEPGRQLTDCPLAKGAAQANGRGQIAFAGQDFEQPNAVYLWDCRSAGTPEPAPATSATLVSLPELPQGWPDAPLPAAEVIRWRAPDGWEIEGILVYPLGYARGQRYPLVVEVHGGPPGVFARSYLGALNHTADTAALAERGCAILRPNVRGSSGYGRDFRFANYRDWGGADFQDAMAGVDHLVEQGIADPDRLGIVGWSYGGYLTGAAITQTTRFKAACVGAGVTDLISFNGTADIPAFVPDYMAAEFWDDLDIYRQRSPVLNAHKVRTPTLILHGERDVRVPLGQGRELYNALHRLNHSPHRTHSDASWQTGSAQRSVERSVPVELVVYPRQGHGFDEPRHVLDVRRRVLAWFDKYLTPES